MINSNWWLSFINDPNVPEDIVRLGVPKESLFDTGLTRWQVRRATWLLHRVLDFKAQLERYAIAPWVSIRI